VCLANGLDMLTTAIGLRLGIPEGNPLMGSVLRLHGELAMFGLKILLVAFLVFVAVRVQRRYRRVWPLMLVMIVPAFLVVVNNVALIAQAYS
jgi:hypothetical protein